MKKIKTERKLCLCCMEEHDVYQVLVKEKNIFKGVSVCYDAQYFYCERADETYADEAMLQRNDIAMKNAYRKSNGLLTTDEIIAVRRKYGISQRDLCLLLGWGCKTITRYETHQVQDNAHDTILRKLGCDPEWFLELLLLARSALSPASYSKYREAGSRLYENAHDVYLKRAITARYTRFMEHPEFTGDKNLSLDAVVDAVCYYANSCQVASLYKVKLMKMLWYGDALAYKRRGHAITGMVYQALPMGAVPIAHESIIELNGIQYDEIEIGNGTAYKFQKTDNRKYPALTEEDTQILDAVIKRFGRASKDEIVSAMHHEKAYIETAPWDIIS